MDESRSKYNINNQCNIYTFKFEVSFIKYNINNQYNIYTLKFEVSFAGSKNIYHIINQQLINMDEFHFKYNILRLTLKFEVNFTASEYIYLSIKNRRISF